MPKELLAFAGAISFFLLSRNRPEVRATSSHLQSKGVKNVHQYLPTAILVFSCNHSLEHLRSAGLIR
jgi:hypothetical protein